MTAPVQPPATYGRPAWNHGKTIQNGEVQYVSVSSLNLADASTDSGCLRRWAYSYKHNIKEGPSKSLDRGNKGHADIERYLKTGDRSHLTSLVLSGMHQLPTPGDDLLVEHPMVPNLPDGSSGKDYALVRAGGLPLIGFIDLIHARRENYGVDDVMETLDDEGVLKIWDHKFPGTTRNCKSGPDLLTETQTVGYGLWAFRAFPQLERVRLGHTYFPVSGNPRAPSVLATRDQLEPHWRHVDAIAHSIIHAAREPDINLIDANTRACKSYGKDCPAKAAGCTAATFNSLSSIMGVTAADRFLAPTNAPDRVHLPVMQFTPPPFNPALVSPNQDPMTTDVNPMTVPFSPNSLMAKLQGLTAGQAPVAVAPPIPLPIAPPAAAPTLSPEVVAAMAVLQAQETSAASNAPPALTFAPPPPPAPPAGPVAATAAQIALLTQINAYGVGMPSFAGDAAAAIALAQNPPIPVTPDLVFPGSGEIATHTINTLDVLPQVLESVQFIAQKKATDAAAAQAAAPSAPAPAQDPARAAMLDAAQAARLAPTIPSILPPDAAPNPAIPNPGLRAELPSAPPIAAPPVAVQAVPVTPSEPTPLPAPAATIAPPPPLVTLAAPGEKPKRIRRTKAQIAADEAAEAEASAGTAPVATPIAPPAPIVAPAPAPIAVQAPTPVAPPAPAPIVTPAPVPVTTLAPTTGAINLYVDCFVDGAHTQSLWPLADKVATYMNEEARKEAGVPDGVPFDFRAADPNGKFGFGRWRGIYSACVHATTIAPANYTIETRSEIGLAMVEAMRDIVRRSGGVLVIGVAR